MATNLHEISIAAPSARVFAALTHQLRAHAEGKSPGPYFRRGGVDG